MILVRDILLNLKLEASIQVLEIDGIKFDIMKLSEALIDDVKSCLTYDEMLTVAANSGIVFDGSRAIDDIELSDSINQIWGNELLDVDSDPCLKYRVGEKVCEISGLTSVIEVMLEKEKEAELLEKGQLNAEDVDEYGNVTIDALNDDIEAEKNINAVG